MIKICHYFSADFQANLRKVVIGHVTCSVRNQPSWLRLLQVTQPITTFLRKDAKNLYRMYYSIYFEITKFCLQTEFSSCKLLECTFYKNYLKTQMSMCHCGQSKQWLPTMFDLFVAPCTVQKFHFSSSYCVRLPLNERTQAVAQRDQNLFEIAIVFLMRFQKICSRNFQCIANYYPFHIQNKITVFERARRERRWHFNQITYLVI